MAYLTYAPALHPLELSNPAEKAEALPYPAGETLEVSGTSLMPLRTLMSRVSAYAYSSARWQASAGISIKARAEYNLQARMLPAA